MKAQPKKFLRWLLLPLLGILIILQFFRIDKTNPQYDPAGDFITIQQPDEDIKAILKVACYDCHSFETRYPWYSNIQPVAWWLVDHIEEGREELNFSVWGEYSARRKDHKMEEAIELVEEEEMPLPSYLITHSDANLSAEQQKALIDWMKAVRISIGYNGEEQSAPANAENKGEQEEENEGEEH